MRYSRMKRGRNQRNYARVMIVVLLILVGIYFLTAGTVGRYLSKFISPILKSNQGEERENLGGTKDQGILNNDGPTEFNLPSQEVESENGSKVKETLKVEAIDFTLIQMGAFNDDENAESIAQDLMSKGGAGYIIDDQYLRVIAMAFQDRKNANEVKEGLKNQSIEAQIYEVQCPGIDMEITASREKTEGIRDAFNIARSSLNQMEELIKDLDNDKMAKEIAIKELDEIKREIALRAEELDRYSYAEEGSTVLKGLKDLLNYLSSAIEEIIQENSSNKVAISAKIKYTYIDIIIKYKAYIESITKS